MSKYTLTSLREADTLLARLFMQDHSCNLAVREDRAFQKDRWLELGCIEVFSESAKREQMLDAVKRGSFEWSVPSLDTARTELVSLLDIKDKDQAKSAQKIRRALAAIAAIGMRVGLQHPKFDPDALEAMPFRRSTTVVTDTSGAIQGGLDFVARYLHPAARVKVPAVAHMEIVNFADRFLSGWRAVRPRPTDLLIDHLMSQGGQRVLIRLELHADTEIERSVILGDPLRSAFQNDRDPDLSELNLSVPIRAYADRLILESARQHQAQASVGHKVKLLTSDQGLARMALAEGMIPLFFSAVEPESLFGQRLTGMILDPFSGRLRQTPIAALIWELATAFGSARLESRDRSHSLVVCAIGESLSWSPYQSHGDLLWCDHQGVPEWPKMAISETSEPSPPVKERDGSTDRPRNAGRRVSLTGRVRSTSAGFSQAQSVAFQRLNVGLLFTLIDALDNYQSLAITQIRKITGIGSVESLDEYRRFLLSAEMVQIDGDNWRVAPSLRELAIALRNEEAEQVGHILRRAPSFSFFSKRLTDTPIGQIWNAEECGRAASTYRSLGEITLLCARIHGEGLYPTLQMPNVEDFANLAIQHFRNLDRGDGLVATGLWLEDLIRSEGIHPEVARRTLNEASIRGILLRTTEGSTTDTRFDRHTIDVLRAVAGKPTVVTVHLYRGDYLIPGKSSSSLRIEGLSQ